MSTGLTTSFRYLTSSANEAATDVLIEALDGADRSTGMLALKALLDRRCCRGHKAVFSRLGKLGDAAREIIDERSDRMEKVVADVLEDPDDKTCEAVCELIISYRLYAAMPVLVSLIVKEETQCKPVLAKTILELTEKYYAELSGVDEQSKRLDQMSLRGRLTSTLEEATRKINRHGCTEVIEAMLMVAKPSNPALRQILQRPQEGCHQPVLDVLSSSQRGGVIRLLLGFLDDETMPRAALGVISKRDDRKFVRYFLTKIGVRLSKSLAESISRFTSFAWASPRHPTLDGLNEKQQDAAVTVIMASKMDRRKVLDVLSYLMQRGNVGGRRAASKAIATFEGPAIVDLILQSLNDEDSQVRANLLVQLRPREVPGSFPLLVGLIDGADDIVRKALRKAMPEFTLDRFLSHFDMIEEELRPTAGHLVKQIDESVVERLVESMESLSPVKRRRTVMAATVMGVVGEMEKTIIGALSDDDHMVRVEVAKALADCKSMPTWGALRDALLDKSFTVKEAAEESLERISVSLAKKLQEEEKESEEVRA